MKKLKLYGEKKWLFGFKRRGFVAEVCVNDGKVVVFSKNSRLRDELQREIDKRAAHNFITRTKAIREEKPGLPRPNIHHIAEPRKPEDHDFLETLKDQSAFWSTQIFDGYEISGVQSRIINE